MGTAQLVVVVVAAILIAVVAIIAIRRLLLARTGGFDVIWRRGPVTGGHGWSLGQARYRGDRLGVYRSLSPLPGAALVLRRSLLILGAVRSPAEDEVGVLPPDVVIVPGTSGETEFELALSMNGLTTLRSWVESRPPGSARAAKQMPTPPRDPDGSAPTDR